MSLTELLVSMVTFGVVSAVVMGLLGTTARVAPRDREHAHAIHELQVGVDRMVRELRTAHGVLGTTHESMDVHVRRRGDDPATTQVETHVNKRVRYSCGEETPGRCVRTEADVGEALPANGDTVIKRVLNAGIPFDPNRRVFSFTQTSASNPVYVKLRIEVPAKGERSDGQNHSVVLEDGFFARNLKLNG